MQVLDITQAAEKDLRYYVLAIVATCKRGGVDGRFSLVIHCGVVIVKD